MSGRAAGLRRPVTFIFFQKNDLTCKECNSPIHDRKGVGAPRKFCSDRCRWRYSKRGKHKKKQSVFECATCGVLFFRLPGKSIKWCSDACRGKHRPALESCACCGEPYIALGPAHKYCSRKCQWTVNIWQTTSGRLNSRMRQGMRRSIGRKKDWRSWEDLVEFDRSDLREHLERQFTKGMTWEKFKAGEIHIDHIVPLSSFSFDSDKDPEFKRAWALTNLRPMWAKDNITKGADRRYLI